MVNLMLEIKGDLENLTNLQPQGGCDDPNFSYYFKVKCGNCGELSQKETCVTLSETVQLPKSKGSANLVQKCKFCGRDGNIVMIPGRGKPLTLEDSESGKYVPLMMFDCRGFEPVGFSFRDGWAAESTSGTKFGDIDLSEGEYVEYDEKGQYPVGISNVQERFVVVK
ncbi:hypothetical protein AMTRI_Chr05g68950 [Amborella trichopoda]|uniref:CXXC motif containing zinc binding protein n=1 Tax=Amborella trichopoda TaxID=13333 RepID=U5CZG3_AMBTC|nr:UPF0587 protein C1orf123 [Amborella trichopoda]ERN15390.1 hypothetical protein AMTR_s00036p00193790 [Amborella trichopoda]|eukprot:XP_006853923.1 UPF0587 protein C1orf123 [Amborella trichopoda]